LQSLAVTEWDYRIKYLSVGSIERYKARLVAQGFHWQIEIDYLETFWAIVEHATTRLILPLVILFQWSLP